MDSKGTSHPAPGDWIRLELHNGGVREGTFIDSDDYGVAFGPDAAPIVTAWKLIEKAYICADENERLVLPL